MLSSSSFQKVQNHFAFIQAATAWRLNISISDMRLVPSWSLSGGVFLCLAVCYVSLKISGLRLKNLESGQSLDSFDILRHVKSVDSLDLHGSVDSLKSKNRLDNIEDVENVDILNNADSLDSLESMSTRQAEALPSVLRVDQWPQGIR